MRASRLVFILMLILIVILAAYLAKSVKSPAAPTTIPLKAGQSGLILQLTDPPQLPALTQSLNITYSSVAVHAYNTSGSVWLSSNTSGSVDLLSLVNFSKTIGSVALSANSSINAVRFNITSAQITINNTNYALSIPNSSITVHISDERAVSSTSIVLLDLSPTVISIMGPNSTRFMLVPSVRAVLVRNATKPSSLSIGSRQQITGQEKAELEAESPNISIGSARIGTSGNSTFVYMRVYDNSNRSVTIRHVLVSGSLNITGKSGMQLTSEDKSGHGIGYNVSAGVGIAVGVLHNTTLDLGSNLSSDTSSNIIEGISLMLNGTLRGIGSIHDLNESSRIIVLRDLLSNLSINSSSSAASPDALEALLKAHLPGNLTLNVSTKARIAAILRNIRVNIEGTEGASVKREASFRMLNFLIESNGTLVLPASESEFEGSAYGLVLQAQGNAALSFNGPITLGESPVSIALLNGSSYKIVVTGEEGARSSVHLNAS